LHGTDGDGISINREACVTDDESGARSWRTPLVVIGIVVALVIVGAAGAFLGRITAPGPDVVVTQGSVVEASPGVEQLPAANTRAPEPLPSATSSTAPPVAIVASTRPASWPAVFQPSPDLPDSAGVATGYRLVSSGISGGQVAGVLASVFGVVGQPKEVDGTWSVGSTGAAQVTVQADPMVSWTFENPSSSASPAAGPTLPADRAIELAGGLLGSIGVDTASIDWQVDRFANGTEVTAWQLLGESRTQLSWRVTLGPAGDIVRASGFSAGLEEVTGYPVLGAASAVRRSALPDWSAIGPAPIFSSAAGSTEPSPSATPTSSPTVTGPVDRPVLSVPLSQVTVTGADLALAQFWQPDGSLLILPAYLLTGADGSRWSLLAVDDPYVRFVDQPYPTVQPAAD
jgi:hypothetical protein